MNSNEAIDTYHQSHVFTNFWSLIKLSKLKNSSSNRYLFSKISQKKKKKRNKRRKGRNSSNSARKRNEAIERAVVKMLEAHPERHNDQPAPKIARGARSTGPNPLLRLTYTYYCIISFGLEWFHDCGRGETTTGRVREKKFVKGREAKLRETRCKNQTNWISFYQVFGIQVFTPLTIFNTNI